MHADAPLSNPMHGTAAPAPQMLYTVPNAAKVLDVSERKMWELVGDGTIPSVKIGASRRISHAALETYIKQLQDA